jgi:hypothetical protein
MSEQRPIPIWQSQLTRLSRFHDPVISSCARNRRSENGIVGAIIVLKLECCNVKMQLFLADVMECADDAALEDAPARRADCSRRRNPLCARNGGSLIRPKFRSSRHCNPYLRLRLYGLLRSARNDDVEAIGATN